jgi:hypothetical protein
MGNALAKFLGNKQVRDLVMLVVISLLDELVNVVSKKRR